MHITPPVQTRLPHAGRFRYRMLHASLLAGLALSSPSLALAADADLERLQQENARLTEEIEALKRRYNLSEPNLSEPKQPETASTATEIGRAHV